MFIIELNYRADLNRIDAAMKAHMAFVRAQYSAGRFLVSGRKIPRDGGIIVAVGGTREEIESVARQDPFVTGGLADFRVIEFRASQKAPDIQQRIDAEPSRS